MSTWFSQDMIYGYKTTYAEFERITGGWDNDDYDQLLANNRLDGFGWLVEDDFSVFGQHILAGEGNGNDSVFAAESELVEVPLLDSAHAESVIRLIQETFPDADDDEIKYYIVGDYS